MKGIIISLSIILLSTQVSAELFPAENAELYYKIGGGRDVPTAVVYSTHTIPLQISARLSLNHSCNRFDPRITITHTLNQIRDSIHNISNEIMTRATAAITQFPMYILIRANPKLYNILNNALISAENQFEVKLKSCEAMRADLAQGKNPFRDWLNISLGEQWKFQIWGNDGHGGTKNLNEAKKAVDELLGNAGIPWIAGEAGGRNQPPIRVVHDIAKAGFNIIVGRSNPNDERAISPEEHNARLASYWRSPLEAAVWLTRIIGDFQIRTCIGCVDQNTSAGLGLLPENQKRAKEIEAKLKQLISGQKPLNKENLLEISAPGLVISSAVIRAMQEQDSNHQALLTQKLAYNIATAKTIDMALIAKRLLFSGAKTPVIRAVEPAQNAIKQAIDQIDQEINDLLLDINLRRQLITDTVGEILAYHYKQKNSANDLPKLVEKPLALEDGGIKA